MVLLQVQLVNGIWVYSYDPTLPYHPGAQGDNNELKLTTRFRRSIITQVLIWNAILLAMATPGAMAASTGLIVIPTIDTQTKGKWTFTVEFDISDGTNNPTAWSLQSEYGLSKRFEAGYNVAMNNVPGQQGQADVKYRLIDDTPKHPGLAIGVFDVQTSMTGNPYMVLGHKFRPARLHLGLTYISSSVQPIAGIDRNLTKRFTFMADYIGGHNNFVSVGGNYQFNPKFGVIAGVEFPNSSHNAPVYTIQFNLD